MKLSRLKSGLVLTVLAAGTITCGSDLAEPRSDPTAVKAVSGDAQTAPVGSTLPVPLVVVITDAEGKPVAGVSVSWEAIGGGSVSTTSVETNDSGQASVQRLLGSTVGSVSTVATVSGLKGSPVTFVATAMPVGSESMGLATVPPTSVLDEEVFAPEQQPAVKILTASGEPDANRDVTVSIGSGGGTLQGQTSATTNAQGVAEFKDLGIDGTGSQTLKFTSGALSVQSAAITVSALRPEATTGSWGPVNNGWGAISGGVVPLHIHLLPTGNILAWGRAGQPVMWQPPADADPTASGTFIEFPVDTMLFCSGHAFMPDGRLMVSGGHLRDDRGLQVTHFFTAEGSGGHWDNAGGALMAAGRWYPTVTILPDGQVLTMAGRDSTDTVVAIPELWNGSRWIQLPGINKKFPYYPRNFVDPKTGRVFYAGEMAQTWYFDVDAVVNGKRGTVTAGPSHRWSFNRDYGSAVMYDDGKILYVGGGGDPNTNNPHSTAASTPTNTAEIIDLTDASPAWQYTDPMEFPRRHLNATVLPNKQVLVTGGVTGGGFNDLSHPARAAELWDPSTGHWTTLVSNARTRGYHAVSLLLPSGQVLHGSGGDANVPVGNPNAGDPYPRETSHEIFSPPYLFKGNRPTITSAPGTVNLGESFTVETPYAAQITQATWVRLPSVTHAFDQSGRLNTLNVVSRTATGVTVTAPNSAAKAPPGYYMLFVMNRNGVPSVGKIIKLAP